MDAMRPTPYYAIWALLIYAWVGNYLIRMALGALLPPIMTELALSYAEAGFGNDVRPLPDGAVRIRRPRARCVHPVRATAAARRRPHRTAGSRATPSRRRRRPRVAVPPRAAHARFLAPGSDGSHAGLCAVRPGDLGAALLRGGGRGRAGPLGGAREPARRARALP